MTKLLIIDDHRVVADGLALGLQSEGYVTQTVSGDRASVEAAVSDLDPDIVLLDLYLGDGTSGIDLVEDLQPGRRKVVALTASTDAQLLADAFEAGVHHVIAKTTPFDRLLLEVERVLANVTDEAESRRQDILAEARRLRREAEERRAPFQRLTTREREVLGMLVGGMQAAAIAEASYVSLATVRSQIRSILSKLGVSSQLTAVSMAIQAGWRPDGSI